MRNPTIVYLLKKEYAPEINIFNLKMTVKSGQEENILKFVHIQNFFPLLNKRKEFMIPKITNFVITRLKCKSSARVKIVLKKD
jgi:hypothetical protein